MPSEQWRTGLIDIVQGSQTVIGTASCDWVNQVSTGHVLKVDRDGESTHIISTVVSATRIVLNANYGGTTGTGLSYLINRSFSVNRNFWRPLQGDYDFAEILSQDTIDKIDTDIANIIAGNASIFRTSASRFIINYDGNAVRLNASLLTASRDYTFPDQNATLAGLSVAQTFTANQTVDASLWVKGNASIDGNLAVGGNLTISEINVTSSIIGQANASIDGDLAVGDDVTVGGGINVTSSIIGQGNASIDGTLAVGGNLSVTGDFYVGGSMIVTSSVLHKGDNIFGDQDSDNHKFFGTTTASGGIFVAGSIIGQANASIDGALSVGGNIIVAGNVDGVDVAALSSNVGTANASIDTLQTNMTNANASIDVLQTNMVNANASIAAIDVSGINASIAGLKSNIVNVAASVALNTASIIHHTTNITRANASIGVNITNITVANASIDALQLNMINANASIATFATASVGANTTNITVANASIDALQSNMVNANASIDVLQTNIINANASIDRNTASIVGHNANIININSSITSFSRSQIAKNASYQLLATNLTGFNTYTNLGCGTPIAFRWATPMVAGQSARFIVGAASHLVNVTGASPLKIISPSWLHSIRYLGVTATYIRTPKGNYAGYSAEIEATDDGLEIIGMGGAWNYDI